MPGPSVDEAKVFRIQRMRRRGVSLSAIAASEGVSVATVRRYTDPGFRIRAVQHSQTHKARRAGRLSFIERAERHHADRKPIFNPKEHELEPMDCTAERMGDPRPGRREMVDRHQVLTQPKRAPWRPGKT